MMPDNEADRLNSLGKEQWTCHGRQGKIRPHATPAAFHMDCRMVCPHMLRRLISWIEVGPK